MAKKEAPAEEIVVASGEALRTVAAWLGVADVADVMEREGLNPEFEQSRQQGLGLGAKYLPHHKALALTSGVEARLGAKLKRSAERRHEEQGRDGPPPAPAGRRGFAAQHGRWGADQPAGRKKQRQQEQQEGQQGAGASGPAGRPAEEEEGSEEEGRGSAFGRAKHTAHRPATYSRSDLLKAGVAAHGKKRKRKGGKATPEGVGT